MKTSERIVYLDYLRTFIIMLVAAFHVSLTFMYKSPQWWYVKSNNTSILFTLFVIIADVFMMPVLFVISGYLTPIGQTKAGSSFFLKNRVIKLGFPWIICTFFFAPFLSVSMARALGHDISYLQMISRLFWTKDYCFQGPYWFLGILLTLQIVSTTANRSDKFKFIFNRLPTSAIWSMLLLIPIAGYSTGSFLYGIDGWQSILYLWSFQPSRVLTYVCYFFAGYIFNLKNQQPSINLAISGIGTLLLSLVFIVLKGRYENCTDFSGYLLQGLCYSGLAFFATCFLFTVFSRTFTKPNRLLSFLSSHSFSIYLIHLPLQVFTANIVTRTIHGIWFQWAVLYMIIIFISIIISLFFKFPALYLIRRNNIVHSIEKA